MSKQKGSLRVFNHRKLPGRDSLSGANGEDVKNDEEKHVGKGIGNAQNTNRPCSPVRRLVRGKRRSLCRGCDQMKMPQLPPADYTPRVYVGPSADEVLALRKQFVNPAVFAYYAKPIMIVEGRGQYA